MLRVAEPVGAQALNSRGVSPKIRSLQDRLMDSLPTDGAWECLSPAQREAILSLHHNRLFGNNHSNNNSGNNNNHHQTSSNSHHHNNNGHNHNGGLQSQHPDDGGCFNRGRRPHNAVPGLGRYYTRSRSYEDKLESETDDSGARGLGGGSGTSSGSHNSHEDDSSDPGVNRSSKNDDGPSPKVGRGLFAKANLKSSSVDRANFRKPSEKSRLRHHGVVTTNGFGNVNKMISKQMNKSSGIANSNITLDCRNVQGEKRRRSCIFADDEDPFRNIDQDPEIIPTVRPTHRTASNFTPNGRDVPVPSDRAGLSRRKILNKYETEVPSLERESNGSDDLPTAKNHEHKMSVMRATPSSEEYDSGVNFRLDSSQDTLESLQQDPSKPLCRLMTSTSASNLHFNSMPYAAGRFYDHNLGTTERHSLAYNNGYGVDVAASEREVIRAPRSPVEFLRASGKEELVSVNAEATKSEQATRCRKEVLAAASYAISAKSLEKNGASGVSPARISGGLRHSASDNLNVYTGCASKFGINENYGKELKGDDEDLMKAAMLGSKGASGSSCEPLKSNLKSSHGDKMNSSLDYRSTMNQDANNRYSNNWNEMILNNQVNLKYNVKYDACNDAGTQAKALANPLAKSSETVSTKTHHQNFDFTSERTSSKNEVNFLHNELERTYDGRDCRLSPKKYNRSKSLDRKYLEDSSEDESDFEARRRFERERRYARNPEWDALRLRNYENRLRRGYALANNSHNNSSSRGSKHTGGGRQNKVNWETALTTDIVALQHRRSATLLADRPPKLKARSAWDLSRLDDDGSREDEELLVKSRAGLRSRWQNMDKNDEGDRDLQRRELGDRVPNARSDGRRDCDDGIGSRFDHRRTPVGRRKLERLKNQQRDEAAPGKANEAVNSLVAGNAAYLAKFEHCEASEMQDTSRRVSEFHQSRKFLKEQWRRRSCDFELDGPSVPSEEPLSLNPLDLDRKRWYRRSCDLDLDFDQHYQQNRERISDYDLDHDLLSRTLQQFQSLPPYREGIPLPEEIILDKKRCVGRREELRNGRIIPSPSPNPTLTQETMNSNVPLSHEERIMLDSGHEMLLLDKSKLSALNRADGRCKSRMEDMFRFQDEFSEDPLENSKNISKNGRAERPKTSIGHYGKEKRERNSSTQHGLKGKLRLFKSILSF